MAPSRGISHRTSASCANCSQDPPSRAVYAGLVLRDKTAVVTTTGLLGVVGLVVLLSVISPPKGDY
jgi:hypothetical protein